MSLGLCAAIRQVEVALIAEIVGPRLVADCFEAICHCLRFPRTTHPFPNERPYYSSLFNFDVNADRRRSHRRLITFTRGDGDGDDGDDDDVNVSAFNGLRLSPSLSPSFAWKRASVCECQCVSVSCL